MEIRTATEGDIPDIQSIYAHHMLTGTGTFEEEPPSVEEMTGELTERLTSLGRAHDLVRPLPGKQGRAALLGDLLNFAPRANDKSRFPATFECVEDLKVHRWLVAYSGGWRAFTATRRELREKFSNAERQNVAIARLELPVISSEAS